MKALFSIWKYVLILLYMSSGLDNILEKIKAFNEFGGIPLCVVRIYSDK